MQYQLMAVPRRLPQEARQLFSSISAYIGLFPANEVDKNRHTSWRTCKRVPYRIGTVL